MKRTLIYALSALALIAGGGAASACGAGVVRFSDSFDTLQKTWGSADKWMSVKNGQMVIAENNGGWYTAEGGGGYRNIDYCADVVLNDTSDEASSYGGLLFWMRDTDHFFAFSITLDGFAAVYRYDGDWTSLIDDTPFDAVHEGKGAVNELRVVTHSGTATFYVNGQMFDSVSATDSPGTSHIGLIVESPDKGNATYAFDNVAVHDPVY
jgi:hypothetical protein